MSNQAGLSNLILTSLNYILEDQGMTKVINIDLVYETNSDAFKALLTFADGTTGTHTVTIEDSVLGANLHARSKATISIP